MSIQERYIFFDEPTHKYTDQYGNNYTSVSTCVHKFVPAFKRDYWAKKKAAEFGTSENSIKAQWKHVNEHSVNNGNKKHNALETAIKSTSKFHKAVNIININNVIRCYSVFDLVANSEIGEMSLEAFYNKIGHKYPLIYRTIEYYVSKGYKIYSEINVYDPINLISGTIDVLLVKGTNFIIIDWKTNRNEIKFESGYYKKDKETNELTDQWIRSRQYMLYPIDNLENCTGTHYTLQLSMYARLVELFGYTPQLILLFHIRDAYINNQYGMPRKDKTGLYIVDPSKPEYVQHHIIPYLRDDVDKIRENIGRNAIVQTQQKFIM